MYVGGSRITGLAGPHLLRRALVSLLQVIGDIESTFQRADDQLEPGAFIAELVGTTPLPRTKITTTP